MKKVIYTKIVGDLFHPGHVRFLKTARALGDKLVVHIVNDTRVQVYKRLPILSQIERAEVIGACQYVDEVHLDGPKVISLNFMDENDYSVYAYGYSTEREAAVKRADCPELPENRICIIPYTVGISTTEIIQRLRERIKTENK